MMKIVEKIKQLFRKEEDRRIHNVNYLVAHITTRPRRICGLITYRIVALATPDQFADIERFVSNRKRYGTLSLDQKEEIEAISKQIIEEETKYGTIIRN